MIHQFVSAEPPKRKRSSSSPSSGSAKTTLRFKISESCNGQRGWSEIIKIEILEGSPESAERAFEVMAQYNESKFSFLRGFQMWALSGMWNKNSKTYNEDAKKITNTLINKPVHIRKHQSIMNETERTIVALLWHENIVDMLEPITKSKTIPVYLKLLDNMCYADYIDRITFQNQIWQFNEMSSLIKTFYNSKIYHDSFPENVDKFAPSEVRFTKVLTKYSTEYNNMVFINNLCQELDMDKTDLISMFHEIRLYNGEDFCSQVATLNEYEGIFSNYNLTKLDIKRMYRYLDKNIKKDQQDSCEYYDDDNSI
mgnify:CR=1 FL=1